MHPCIRVLLGDMPLWLLRDLTAAIADQADMEVVGKTGCRGIALLAEARRLRPSAVVLGSDDGELRGEISQLLGELPEVGVVAVVLDEPFQVRLAVGRAVLTGGGREQELLEMIRSVVGTEVKTPAPGLPRAIQEEAENPRTE